MAKKTEKVVYCGAMGGGVQFAIRPGRLIEVKPGQEVELENDDVGCVVCHGHKETAKKCKSCKGTGKMGRVDALCWPHERRGPQWKRVNDVRKSKNLTADEGAA